MRSLALTGRRLAAAALAFVVAAPSLRAQTFPIEDPVLRRIWSQGMDSSQVERLTQVLLDSVGPRLTGTVAMEAAQRWLLRTYAGWGVTARNEKYGTWKGWRRGTSHLDLVAPRVRTLDATLLGWSPGTRGRLEAPVILLPDLPDSAAYARWMPTAKGKFVLTSFPQPTCRPDEDWQRSATPASFDRMRRARDSARTAWTARTTRVSADPRQLHLRLDAAGAAGILTSTWTGAWGAERVFTARTSRAPNFALSCEDYGLLARLAERGQGPVVRAQADAELRGEVPVFNTIAEIRGSEKPDEYVVLSAHFDSFDAGSGATDNGTGTTAVLEAVRILRQAYPQPKRTILVGHWSGEEQGLVGSRAFAADHPEIVNNVQALFNHDGGTGRTTSIGMEGFTGAGEVFGRWFARLPAELTRGVRLDIPDNPGAGGTDHASFVCHGAPAFDLNPEPWNYFAYTWHTDIDTYDKVVMDDLRMNATLMAMLAYLASEEPERFPRARREQVSGGMRARAGTRSWPECSVPPRTSAESTR